MVRPTPAALLAGVVLLAFPLTAAAEAFRSHPPIRPLPGPSTRPLTEGPTFFVDETKGDDAHDGSRDRPWRTITHAATKLRPGDTLVLRGGTYYEPASVSVAGTPDRPITIRSHPGELAVVDAGLREFFDDPARGWEPCPGGAEGEYWSTRAYPGLRSTEREHAHVCGNFGDSLVPLQAYRFRIDLQSANEFWLVDKKGSPSKGIYSGPGVWYDLATERIHARLAHTTLAGLGEDHYRGETDPRKLPLVIAGGVDRAALRLADCRHLRVQDLCVRGARSTTIDVANGEAVELDNVVAYGGQHPVRVANTRGFRFVSSACRGVSAPWSWRGAQKYRGFEGNLFMAGKYGGGNADFELAHSEFTDAHDGLWLGNIKGVRLHHCLVDNVNDDGIFLTAHTDDKGEVWGGDVRIYQNVLSRSLSMLAFGIGHGKQERLGGGVYVYRNLFDLRRPVPYHRPKGPEGPEELGSPGRVWGEHGSPTWEPMYFYHNTVVTREPAFRNYYGAGLASHTQRTTRRLFNNLFLQLDGPPGFVFADPAHDLHADYNLHWAYSAGASTAPATAPAAGGDLLARFRGGKVFAASKGAYGPGWAAHDVYADPKLRQFDADWRAPLDVGPRPGSPAIDAGATIPAEWPDVLREADAGKPDVGALPAGMAMPAVGRTADTSR